MVCHLHIDDAWQATTIMTTLTYGIDGEFGEVSSPISKDFGLYIQGAVWYFGHPPEPRAFALNGKFEVLKTAEQRAEIALGALTTPIFYRCTSLSEWKKM